MDEDDLVMEYDERGDETQLVAAWASNGLTKERGDESELAAAWTRMISSWNMMSGGTRLNS